MNKEIFSRLYPIFSEDEMQRLNHAHVVVIGLGGVGGTVVEMLSRTGIGSFTLIDFDRVQLSNLNRQIISTLPSLGEYKAKLFQQRILEINPSSFINVKVVRFTNENQEIIPNDATFIVDAIDSVEDKITLIKYCLTHSLPFVSIMGMALKINPTAVKVVKMNQTQYDPLAKIVRTKLRKEGINLNFDVVASFEQPKEKVNGVLGSYMGVTSMAGLIAGDYVIKRILDMEVK